MRQLRRFIGLSAGDQRLLVTSAALLAAITLGLRLIPFNLVKKLLGKINRGSREMHDTQEEISRRVVWAVSAAGRRLPRTGNCLAEALATQVMLQRRGYSAALRIGVGRNGKGEFIAHAWLEADGKVLIGGTQSPTRFVPLPPLEGDLR